MVNKFSVGDRVGQSHYIDGNGRLLKYEFVKNDPVVCGVISKIIDDDYVFITWDNYNNYTPLLAVDIKTLSFETDIQKEFSTFEKEYDLLVAKITPKLKEAAILINEANVFAKENGQTLYHMNEVMNELSRVMNSIGWRNSSYDC